MEDFVGQLDLMRESMKRNQQMIESSNAIIDKQKTIIMELGELNKDLTQKAASARDSINLVKKEHQERLKNEMDANKKVSQEKDAKIKELQKINKNLEKNMDQLRQRYDHMMRSIREKVTEDLKKAEEKSKEELERQNTKMRQTRSYYEAEVKDRDEKIRKLQKELQNSKSSKKNHGESIEAAYLRTMSSSPGPNKPKKSPKSNLKRGKNKGASDADIEFLEEQISLLSRVGPSGPNKRRVTFEGDEESQSDEQQASTSAKKASTSDESDDIARYLEARKKPDDDDDDVLNSSLEEELLRVPIDGEPPITRRVKLVKRSPEDLEMD